VKKLRLITRTALPLFACFPAAAIAQQAPAPNPPQGAEAARQITFSADQLVYDSDNDIVTASGAVHMISEGDELYADTVTWNRKTDEAHAQGHVRVINAQGDVAYSETATLTNNLKNGVAENMLLVLQNGGRLAAQRATRVNGTTTLYRAAYSPCPVIDDKGCPKNPTWKITALKVVHDPVKHRISYKGATLNLFGMPIIGLPGLSHPDGSGQGGTGLLVPTFRLSRNNGAEITTPFYWRMADNRDLTVTPHFYTKVLPMLEGEYRQLTSLGAFDVHAYVTESSRADLAATTDTTQKRIRAYIEGTGKFQLSPEWSITFSGRYVTDQTFLRRYDISYDDRLRSVIEAERIGPESYISIAGWGFQSLRVSDVGRTQPIALPAIDARWRLHEGLTGGRIEIQANSLAIMRTDGQDTQRAFVGARWDNRSITAWGQELTFTGYARGDLYHTADIDPSTPAIYSGTAGWHGRAIAAAAAELRWPFIGRFLGGTQQFAPRLQFVGSTTSGNLSIPNEDARSIDLEDSNLFALNRFPGYDRWEDGARVTYGFDWSLDLPSFSIQTTIGQSYRLNRKPSIFPVGTGLSERFSDVVGRTTIRYGSWLRITDRFRLDKSGFAIRRNEIDAAVGGRRTYAEVGYLRLNRDIPSTLEDLRDREELRLGGRVQITRFWSIFGSTVVDLTSRHEDPLSSADGWEPVKHRIGITYEDECLEIGVTWKRDYEQVGDFRKGNTFLFEVALKNLGR
jgi:LPS-assembly protein